MLVNVRHRLGGGRSLERGDIIKTGENGRAALLLEDETMVRLNKNSRLVLERLHHSTELRVH